MRHVACMNVSVYNSRGFSTLVLSFYLQTDSEFRNILFGFFGFATKHSVAMDIAFETSKGYSLILARAFNKVNDFC